MAHQVCANTCQQLGIDFIEKHFCLLQKDVNRKLTQPEVQELRVIRMIGDFQLHRSILRRYYKHKQILTDPYWLEISNHFRQYCIEKDYSSVTIDHYVKQSIRFLDYLTAQGITPCNGMTIDHINKHTYHMEVMLANPTDNGRKVKPAVEFIIYINSWNLSQLITLIINFIYIPSHSLFSHITTILILSYY